MSLKPIIVIPARLGAVRLPEKPLQTLWGEPLIRHVVRSALQANIAPILLAVDDKRIADCVSDLDVQIVFTPTDLASGSDRVWAAISSLPDRGKQYDVIINLQGDMPTIPPQHLQAVIEGLKQEPQADITTPIITMPESKASAPQKVKAAVSIAQGEKQGRALYFSRQAIPANKGVYYCHIGIYAYRYTALQRFVSLPVGVLEQREKLEQLRALENNMRIDAVLVEDNNPSIDTLEDLQLLEATRTKVGDLWVQKT